MFGSMLLSNNLRAALTALLSDGTTVANWQRGVGITGTTNASDWANQVTAAWGNPAVIAGSLVQATGAAQPAIGADGSLTFDGVDDRMVSIISSFAQPQEAWIVFNPVSWVTGKYIFDVSANGAAFEQYGAVANYALYAGVVFAGTDGSIPTGAFGLARLLFNGVNSAIITSTTSNVGYAGAGPLPGPVNFTLADYGSGGGAHLANVVVKEIILRNAITSAGDAVLIGTYLKALNGVA